MTAHNLPGANDFQKVTLASGLHNAVDFAFAPDGRIFIVERQGLIKIYKPSTQSTVNAGTISVYAGFEDGLVGMAFDPNFTTNNYIYVHYCPSNPQVNRVSRFTMSGDTWNVGSEVVLLEWGVQRSSCCHAAGDMEFDTSGNLYIATGDNTQHGNYAALDESNSNNSAEKSSANTMDLRGKILRITPTANGGYTIPAGNLFTNSSEGKPEIYVMGCRNPYRIYIDPVTNWLFWADVGPDGNSAGPDGPAAVDEINLTKQAGNWGWPHFIGANGAYRNTYLNYFFNPAQPTNHSQWNTGPIELPPAQPSVLSFPRACYLTGPIYHFDPSIQSTGKLPIQFDGHYFYFEFNHSKMYVADVDGQGNISNQVHWASSLVTGLGLIETKISPLNHHLYVLEYGAGCCPGNVATGKLTRYDYIGEVPNQQPVAMMTATPEAGPTPLTVNFSSAGSFDPDNDPISFEWDFDTNGSIDSTAANPTHTYATPGDVNAQLRVLDNQGAVGVDNITIHAGNNFPVVTFISPPDGGFIEWNHSVDYHVLVDDAEDGSTSDSSISCNDVTIVPSLGHLDHSHDGAPESACMGTIDLVHTHDLDGSQDIFWVINGSYTDTHGLTAFEQIRLHPKRVEAEFFDNETSTQTLPNNDPLVGGLLSVRALLDGATLVYEGRNLSGIDSVLFRVATSAAGSSIELRAGSPTGTLIASVAVPNTGGPDQWADVISNVTNPGGKNDLYVVFKGPAAASQMFDLNYVEFQGDGVSYDTFPPFMDHVELIGPSTLAVRFSEQVSAATAENSGNFSVSAGVNVTAASLQSDGKTVFLTTSLLPADSLLVITATDIADLSGLVAAVSQITYAPFTSMESLVRINCGGPTVTVSGDTWMADTYFSGGSTYPSSTSIAQTDADVLYQTERYGGVTYNIPVPEDGDYEVVLHFAEIYHGVVGGGGVGARVFNVDVEGGQGALTSYDIIAAVGAATADVHTFSNISVQDGFLTIVLTTITDNAKISAIEVLSTAMGPGPAPAITINSPADGAFVVPPFDLIVDVSNWEVALGSSHFHLVIDGVNQGGQYTLDPISIDTLAPGNHTLRVELADASHVFTGIFDEIAVLVGVPPPLPAEILVADFEGGADPFGYVDDAFRGTNEPSYASGGLSDAGYSGDCLSVTLGGQDTNDIEGMSGAWQTTFNLPVPSVVTVSLYYKLTMTTAYEPNECSQVLVAIDGTLVVTQGADYLVEQCDGGDTGWQQAVFDVNLGAGNHTLSVGGYNDLKTFSDEVTTVLIDEISITTPVVPPAVMISSPIDGADVQQQFDVTWSVENWDIMPGGQHAHSFVDGVLNGTHDAVAPIGLDLMPGLRTIRIELVNADDSLTGVFDEVTVNVEEPAPTEPPVIQMSPVNQSVCEGDAAMFCVSALGGGLNYEWRKDGVVIPNATSDCYSIAMVTPADVGVYDCVVSNVVGSVMSAAATLAIIPPPTITQAPPATVMLDEEQMLEICVVADGSGLTYEWHKDGVLLPGETGSCYSVASATPADNGLYEVTVYGTCPISVTSQVSVTPAPTPYLLMQDFNSGAGGFGYIDDAFRNTNQPSYASGEIATGAGYTGDCLSVILGGQDTNNIDGMSGAWQATFNLPVPMVVTVSLYYKLTMTSAYESNECSQALVAIDGNLVVTQGMDYLVEECGSSDTGWQQVIFDIDLGAGNHTIVIGGYNDKKTWFDEITTVYVDDVSIATPVPPPAVTIASPADGADVQQQFDVTWSVENWDVMPGGQYAQSFVGGVLHGTHETVAPIAFDLIPGLHTIRVELVNADDTLTGVFDEVTVNVEEPAPTEPPMIQAEPLDQSVCEGDPATFCVSVVGTGISYEWRMGGVTIPNATSDCYTVASVTPADVGSYDCVISNIIGTVTSMPASLAITQPPSITQAPPATITLDEGQMLEICVVASGSGLTYEWYRDSTLLGGETGSCYSVAAVTPTHAGLYEITVFGPCPTTVTCQVTVIPAPTPYLIMQDFGSDAGGFSYVDDAFRGTNSPQYASGTYASAAGLSGGALCVNLGGMDDDDIVGMSGGWQATFSMPSAGDATISFYYLLQMSTEYENNECGEVLVSIDDVLVSPIVPDFVVQLCGGGDTGWQQVTIDVTLDAGMHTLCLGGYNSKKTFHDESLVIYFDDVTVEGPPIIDPPTDPPVIQTHPANQNVCEGDPAMFCVDVVGTGLSFQWRHEGVAIGGATGNCFSIASVVQVDVGSYDVVVSNLLGTVMSIPATLAITPGPTITQAPPSMVTIDAGDMLEICVVANGAGLTYQWSKDGVPLAGQTASCYSVASTTAADAGLYEVTVLGVCSTSVTSQVSIQGGPMPVLISEDFEGDTGGFTYFDDAFMNTNNPAYASGSFAAGVGYSGDCISVTLGGQDNNNISGMSGGWQATFGLSAPTVVTVDLKYKLTMADPYETNECSQALVAIDGTLVNTGGNDYLAEECGGGDTGWQQIVFDVNLGTGSHTLEVGGYNNIKTWANESTTIFFDEILVTTSDPLPPMPAVSITSPNDGASVTLPFDVAFVVVDHDPDVELSIDGSSVDTTTTVTPFTVTNLSLGAHTLTLTLLDSGGQPTMYSDTISVNVIAQPSILPLDQWQRHTIDSSLPYRCVFITGGDVNGDGDDDIITGGWWYENPGNFTSNWVEHTVGAPMHNMAWVRDFDQDGDLDILGTNGQYTGIDMSWAKNNGNGNFTILTNVDNGVSSFGEKMISGIDLDQFFPGGPQQLAISWNGGETGSSQIQLLTIPANPSTQQWTLSNAHSSSTGEGIDAGDIDDDGDIDIFQGTQWLENQGASWQVHTTNASLSSHVDRCRLADIDGDGDVDGAVGFLSGGSSIVWLEAPANPTGTWTSHTIHSNVGGGLSLDVADMDLDGDVDVIHGELWGQGRCFIYENVNGGSSWTIHQIDPGGGIEHHDGARVYDIDSDGDLDILTIGWNNLKVWCLENQAIP